MRVHGSAMWCRARGHEEIFIYGSGLGLNDSG